MTTTNALGFFLLGLLMGFVPVLLPGYFPPSGMGGSNTSGLWLEFMGTMQALIGAIFGVLHKVVPLAGRLMTVRPPQLHLLGQPAPGVLLRLPAVDVANDIPDDEQKMAA